jgi:hypothetical protein
MSFPPVDASSPAVHADIHRISGSARMGTMLFKRFIALLAVADGG